MTQRGSKARWFWTGALVAGACDIVYAIVFSYIRRGTAPSRILQSVASGLLGADAYTGGARTAALGLFLHFMNATIWTAIFFIAASRQPALLRRPFVVGPLYGLVIYTGMYYVVLPLSKVGLLPFPPLVVFVTGVLVHMFLIGTPIVLAARRAFAA